MFCLFAALTFSVHENFKPKSKPKPNTNQAFSGENWKLPGMLVAFGFPGLCFVLFLISNLCLSNLQSSGAVPLLTMFGIVFVWFGVSSPLAVTGSYLGHMREVRHFLL